MHAFDDAWTVEDMPGPRCLADAALLPNGRVVVINGVEQGFGALPLDLSTPPANEPVNQPWIYTPWAPEGQRYSVPGGDDCTAAAALPCGPAGKALLASPHACLSFRVPL